MSFFRNWSYLFLLIAFTVPTTGCAPSPSSNSPPTYTKRTFSFQTLTNVDLLLRVLPTTSPVTDIPPQLLTQFPHLSEAYLRLFFNYFNNPNEQHRELEFCDCADAQSGPRILTTLAQVNALLEEVPSHQRGEKLVHVAFAEQGYFQTYMLAWLMSTVGFQNLEIYGIGIASPIPEEIRTRLFALPGIHLGRHFSSASDYIQAVNDGRASRAHSYDIIDAGPHNEALDQVNAKLYQPFSAYLRGTFHSAHGVNGRMQYFKGLLYPGAMPFFICTGSYLNVYDGLHNPRNVLASDSDKRHWASPVIEDFCNGVPSDVKEARTQDEFTQRLGNYADHWLRTYRSSQLTSTQQIQQASAWDELAYMIEQTQAPQVNPIIFSLHMSQISGPVRYESTLREVSLSPIVQRLDVGTGVTSRNWP